MEVSAPPRPSSQSATTIAFSQVQQRFPLTVNGGHIVSSSVVVINGTALRTQILSSSQFQVALTTAVITGSGTASAPVKTPSETSGDLDWTSGGTSHALTLTIA